ncbi:MAG: very short patch repair endonuclease [Synergistaceae bacterium]|jgi:DNA mismatch endonuclease (patch repair protein)|nr:very short patch repair endonuclease [Synergistaceae bacterium]
MPRDPSITHKIMSAIKSKDTRPELLLRKTLWHRGLRYKVNYKSLPGKPDIVFTKAKLAVFCDGDYWHGHNWALRGMSSLEDELKGYSDYWKDKILGNISRDQTNTILLESEGWFVIRVWESDIKSDVGKCADIIEAAYRSKRG